MVDFKKLKSKKSKPININPIEIFRRTPKPKGVNDLYSSQSEVLSSWFDSRENPDTIIKLHTGGGKTMVGLLIAQSTMNELNRPVLYLTPNNQLVKQTIAKAKELGIKTVEYIKGSSLPDEFINGQAVMIANYYTLFNGRSKFGIQGSRDIQKVAAIIFDDAHAALPVVRDCFSLDISRQNESEAYSEICTLFADDFKKINKEGTFSDVISGEENIVLDVPYWAWYDKKTIVNTIIKKYECANSISWPLLRDNLHLCHALISKNNFTITPILPLMNMFPTFINADRKVYMSATIADDSDIIRTFGISKDSVDNTLTSKSVAGISERMILIPSLMDFSFKVPEDPKTLLKWISEKKLGSVVLSPSDKTAEKWEPEVQFIKGSNVENVVKNMQNDLEYGPVVFSNRYDGIDLPNNSCRILVMDGLPLGTSNYEMYRATALMGGDAITRMVAQRIEQGLGRGARGASDYCVNIIVGSDLSSWIMRSSNFSNFTSATKAQIEMGIEISKEVSDLHSLSKVIVQCLRRDSEWTDYYSDGLADYLDNDQVNTSDISFALIENKVINTWYSGFNDKAINQIEKYLTNNTITNNEKGWLEQLASKISYSWGNKELSTDFQKRAYANNRNLVRSLQEPIYQKIVIPNNQAESIVNNIKDYRNRRAVIDEIDNFTSFLSPHSSANQFEQALTQLGSFIGFSAERFDDEGIGPDVLWLINDTTGIIIEAKSRKKKGNAFRKDEHGQLLVAEKWFQKHYPSMKSVLVSIHPDNRSTKSAHAQTTYVLDYKNLEKIIVDTKSLYDNLVESNLIGKELLYRCQELLNGSPLNQNLIIQSYLNTFE